jgi:tetratricopeptide (TPR) repeat protein
MYDVARETLEAAGMRLLVAGVDGNTGFLQFKAGRYTEALQAFSRARDTFETLQLGKDVAQCDRETADVYLELNLIREAQETYERVVPVFVELQMTAEAARAQMGLAATLAAQQRYDEALEALERAELAFHEEQNPIGVARAQLQRAEWGRGLETTQGEEARRQALAACRTFQQHGLQLASAHSRLVLAELRMDAGETPERVLRQLLKEAETGEYVTLLWRIEGALARACATAGKPRAALRHYRRAIDAVERLRMLLPGEDCKIAFLKDKLRIHEEMLALLLERGTPAALAEAFEIAERAKSRTLLELLSGPIDSAAADSPGGQALLQRLEELRAQLSWDYGRMGEFQAGASRLPRADAALTERLRALHSEYRRTRRQFQLLGANGDFGEDRSVPSVRHLRSLLGDDEHLVEYVTVGEEVLAFLLGRNGFHVVRHLAQQTHVARQVERLRFQWSKFRLGGSYVARHGPQLIAGTRSILRELYHQLLAPLAGLLPGTRLTIVPHGVLHSIPFHALFDGEQYALDRWEFAYAPSAAVWRACRLRSDPDAERSLVFGVSDPQTAHVSDEVAALQNLLPNATVYEDDAATLAAVPAGGAYRYVHFATHAIFRRDNPRFSGLRLADGWLTANDLYRRRLDCSLATLSACHTGMNALGPGDEVIGLTRGFLHAGARAVLVSLWLAHDAATAELMECCYAELTRGTGRAAALRAAQQAVRARFPHPYHWAAFALVGAR